MKIDRKRFYAFKKAFPNYTSREIIKALRYPQDIAKALVSVQPMDAAGEAWMQLYKAAKSEKELIAEGYEPVCPHIRLMWIKKDK